jgi:hypothetical protein
MTEKQILAEIFKEVNELYGLHQNSIADFEKCRDFGRRLAVLLDKLEGQECRLCSPLADRVMDILSCCSPKIGSHCESSERTKSMLTRVKDNIEDELKRL